MSVYGGLSCVDCMTTGVAPCCAGGMWDVGAVGWEDGMGGGLDRCTMPLRWGGVALVRHLGAPSVVADCVCGGVAGMDIYGTAVSIQLQSRDSAISGMKMAG